LLVLAKIVLLAVAVVAVAAADLVVNMAAAAVVVVAAAAVAAVIDRLERLLNFTRGLANTKSRFLCPATKHVGGLATNLPGSVISPGPSWRLAPVSRP
jgi:hypothetical protein